MSRVLLCRFIGMVVFVLLIMGVCGMFFCRFASFWNLFHPSRCNKLLSRA